MRGRLLLFQPAPPQMSALESFSSETNEDKSLRRVSSRLFDTLSFHALNSFINENAAAFVESLNSTSMSI